ncbi:MAG: corrinoid protein [Candidatus Bathyarchaeia archaeon]
MEKIAKALADLDAENLRSLVDEAIRQSVPAAEIMEKGLKRGLTMVGERFEKLEYFLSELLFASSIMEEAVKKLAPHLKGEAVSKKGRIVLGTVRGDIHDIGKNIFKMFAEGSGFEVIDLGVDVEPQVFAQAVAEKKPDVVGLSALLTTTVPEIKTVVEELERKGLRDRVKVLLGGNAVTEEFGREVGADGVAADAVQGVNLCREWASG